MIIYFEIDVLRADI